MIILLDHSEFNLYKIMEELKSDRVIPIMQSVRDYKLMEETFKNL